MNLAEGLSSCPVLEVSGETDIEIKEIVTDSRHVTEGALFAALPGTQVNGRRFIGDAIRRGAAAILFEGAEENASQTTPPLGKATWIRVEDARASLFSLASHFYGRPEMRLTGVTGTNGKTTTAFLIQSLFQADGQKTGLIGTIQYDAGENPVPASRTTPDIVELQALFAHMQRLGVTNAVMEVSSHGLDQRRLQGLSFETAVFTNLTQDHLDYHKTMEAYFAAKKKLFDQTDGPCVINVDDPWGRTLKGEITGRCIGYGVERHEEIYPRSVVSTLSGITMLVETPIGVLSVVSPLVGHHNVYNLLAAIGVGVASGLSKEVIAAGIGRMKSVPGRFEKIDVGQDFLVVVDYAHTEDALSRLLQSVSSLALGHVITVFGCGGDRDRGKRPMMGKAASLYSRLSILTSDNPRSEPPLSIIAEIEAGMLPNAAYTVIPDRGEAIAHAIGLAKRSDAVVIAGKGHETVQRIGDREIPFDDREVARRALSEKFCARRN